MNIISQTIGEEHPDHKLLNNKKLQAEHVESKTTIIYYASDGGTKVSELYDITVSAALPFNDHVSISVQRTRI